MANEVTVTVADVRALKGAITVRAKATEALAFGDAVYVDTATGDIPNVSKADAGALDINYLSLGVVVTGSPDYPGNTVIAAGDPCDVAVIGPVTGFLGMTPGTTVWLSDTAGRLSSVVGTKSMVLGYALTAATVFLMPGFYVRGT
jgi:hypothetical protein